LEYCQFRSWWR